MTCTSHGASDVSVVLVTLIAVAFDGSIHATVRTEGGTDCNK